MRRRAAQNSGPKGPAEYWLDRLMRLSNSDDENQPRRLFQVAHGSRLYGLSHADSDVDLWQVWDGLPAGMSGSRHTEGRIDVMVLSFKNFMKLANLGAPQALEAMYAPRQELDLFYNFRRNFRPNTAMAFERYQSAIRRFADSPAPKVRRHSARLTHDLELLMAYGHFDPTAFARTEIAHIELYTEESLALIHP